MMEQMQTAVVFEGGSLDGVESQVDWVVPIIEHAIIRADSPYRMVYGNGEDAGPAFEFDVYHLTNRSKGQRHVYQWKEFRAPRVTFCDIEGCEEH